MKKLIIISAMLLSITLPQQLLSFEKAIPIAYATAWVGGAALETVSLFSKSVRHMIYGNNPVNDQTKNILNDILSPLNMTTPTDINVSRSLLPTFAGNIFSNHDSLFISKKILEEIQSGASLNDQTKKELVAAALMIQNNFDGKILTAFIATPIAVWASIHCLNALLQKITSSNHTHHLVKKLASITKQCKESWQAKTLISLSIVGTLSLLQRYSIMAQAAALII